MKALLFAIFTVVIVFFALAFLFNYVLSFFAVSFLTMALSLVFGVVAAVSACFAANKVFNWIE